MYQINYFLPAALLLLVSASSAQAQFKSEYRVYQIKVDTHETGSYTQTITTYGEGTTDIVNKSDMKLKVLGITYQQAYRGQERWKEGKLQYLASASNDNGTPHTLQVNADKDRLIVKEGGKERSANAQAWSSSYWTLPPAEQRNKQSYMLDADMGIETQVTWQNLGKDSLVVGGQRVTCTHYRVAGNGMATADVWFDENDRLVRREGLRKNRKVTLQLISSEIR